MELQAFRRLAGVTDRPNAPVPFARDVLGDGLAVLDGDVLEEFVREAEFPGEEMDDFVIALRFSRPDPSG
jgi:hypothetical protein